MFDLIRWLLFLPPAGYFVVGAVFNAQVVFITSRRRVVDEPEPSLAPLVPGLAGVVACLVAPWPPLARWAWLPLLLDIGSGPYLLITAWTVWRSACASKGQVKLEVNDAFAGMREALTGCLVGGAVGDALGLPMEGIPPRRARKLRSPPLQHALVGRWGMVSDDTEHAAMTAAALAISGGDPALFSRTLARLLRGWLASLPAGCGLATGRAILKLWVGFPPTSSGVWSAGNGPAMRAAVIGVAWGDQPQQMLDLVRASSVLTHSDPKATVGAHAVALAAWQATQGMCDPVALSGTLRADHGDVAEPLLELIDRAIASADAGQSTPDFCHSLCGESGVSGFIDHTVAVAMHIWRTSPDEYRSAIETSVECGGDTDTLAAVVGGIVGARVGESGIQLEWRQGIKDWPISLGYLTKLAAALARGRSLSQPVAPPRAVWLFRFARNLVFLAIVLIHGFRRMLPPY